MAGILICFVYWTSQHLECYLAHCNYYHSELKRAPIRKYGSVTNQGKKELYSTLEVRKSLFKRFVFNSSVLFQEKIKVRKNWSMGIFSTVTTLQSIFVFHSFTKVSMGSYCLTLSKANNCVTLALGKWETGNIVLRCLDS